MKSVKATVTALVFLAAVSGCHSLTPEQQLLAYWAERKAELATVDTTNGVDANEATVLAQLYFPRAFVACGATSFDGDDGSRWRFHTAVGIMAKPAAPIFVSKQTGMIECEGRPAVTNLHSLVDPNDKTFPW